MIRTSKTIHAAMLAVLVCSAPLYGQVIVDRVGSVALVSSPAQLNAGGSPDFAEGVQAVHGDPSPGAVESNIDDYTYQDEQINISPDDGVVTVLRTNQKNLVQPFVTKLYELQNATPREVVNAFKVACGKEGGRAEVVMDPNTGRNYIQVICPPFQLPYVEQTIQVMDKSYLQEYNDGSAEVYFQAMHRDISSVDAIAFDVGTTDASLRQIDVRNNSIHYLDDPSSVDFYLGLAKQVDIPPHQVVFEGAIYQINESDDKRIGLDYIAWKNGPGRTLWSFILQGSNTEDYRNTNLSPSEPVSPTAPIEEISHEARYFAVNALITTAYLDFLHSKGDAELVSRFTINTKSGRTGTYSRLDEITTFSAELRDDARTLNYRNSGMAGIFMSVTPFIGTESMEVDINVEIGDVAGLTPQGLPIMSTRSFSSTARLVDGEPYVLSGITRDEKVDMNQGIPMLKDIPVLGYAFGGDVKTDRESRLIVVLTPKVYLGGQEDTEYPSYVETAMYEAENDERPDRPSNNYGYDMWLFDK